MRTFVSLLLALGLAMPVFAQDEGDMMAVEEAAAEEAVAVRQQMRMGFEEYAERRRWMLEDNMGLTPEQEEFFWPLYDEYTIAQTEIMNRLGEVIVSYAEAYNSDSMTEDLADDLLDEWLDIQEDEVDLKKRYKRKFSRHLSAIVVVRFFQLENKLDAVFDVGVASQVPLIR